MVYCLNQKYRGGCKRFPLFSILDLYSYRSRNLRFPPRSRNLRFPSRSRNLRFPSRSRNLRFPSRSRNLRFPSRSRNLRFPSRSRNLRFPSRSRNLRFPSRSRNRRFLLRTWFSERTPTRKENRIKRFSRRHSILFKPLLMRSFCSGVLLTPSKPLIFASKIRHKQCATTKPHKQKKKII